MPRRRALYFEKKVLWITNRAVLERDRFSPGSCWPWVIICTHTKKNCDLKKKKQKKVWKKKKSSLVAPRATHQQRIRGVQQSQIKEMFFCALLKKMI
jgi:hypothetical protein